MDFSKKSPARVSATSDPRFEPLIDTEQAAALLRIHPKTLQRMARRGEVRGYQLGKLLECPAFFEPVALIETGNQGANDGTTEEAYA